MILEKKEDHKIVDVIVQNRAQASDRQFTYLAPSDITIGQRVLVPFGKSKLPISGIVISFNNKVPEGVKSIHSIVEKSPIVDQKILEVAYFIRNNTLCSFMDAIELFYPKGENIKSQFEEYVELKESSSKVDQQILELRKNAIIQLEVLKILRQGPQKRKHLEKLLGKNLRNPLNKLEELGLIQIKKERNLEFSMDITNTAFSFPFTHQQKQAIDIIESMRRSQKKVPILLHGITGSGKTQIYVKAIDNTLKEGKQGIVLVPEISLTPQTVERFYQAFGSKIAVLHSQLSNRDRQLHWQRMKHGECQVVIGARSALFAPFWNLGMIIIDECHESAYNSDKTPRYKAVDVAEKLAQVRNAILILGSATPTVEQYYNAHTGQYQLVELLNRPNNFSLPRIELIDMSDEFKQGNKKSISHKMERTIETVLDRNEQCILFLNRRGFANFLSCPICGHVHKCPQCDITMHYHKVDNTLKCHYCNYTSPFNKKCPSCENGVMDELGTGIQKIEEELKNAFPNAAILRMDRDTTRSKGAHEQILSDFRNQKAGILLGTQMIGKGLDFPNVTFVGILNGDIGLHTPDFRSAEKTVALIEQVSGRCGRGEKKGLCFVQTYEKNHWIYPFVINHDYRGFYQAELEMRKRFNYSPFSKMVRVIFSSSNMYFSGDSAQKFTHAIKFYLDKTANQVEILGPSPCLVTRIENQFRWQVLLKMQNQDDINWMKSITRFLLSEKRSVLLSKGVKVLLEMDPDRML